MAEPLPVFAQPDQLCLRTSQPVVRKVVELPRQAVSECDINRTFLEEPAVQDELDALSSTIVGQMFSDGQYEILGNYPEDFLAAPNLAIAAGSPQFVIGVSGYTGSGKTAISGLLKRQGFNDVSFSRVIASMFPRPDGRELSRSELQQLGEELHQTPGQRWLDWQVLKLAQQYKHAVIDGLRFPEDHAFFVECFGRNFIHIHVTAPYDVRRKRFIARGGTTEDYASAMLSPTESNVAALRDLSHVKIYNDGRIDKLDDLLQDKLSDLTQGSALGCQ